MSELFAEALTRFQSVMSRARQLDVREPTAVAIATVTAAGTPSVRMVLLRGYDVRGFVFFTNSQSAKGRHLAAHPHAAMCLYWDPLQEQVRIEGQVEIVADAECDRYWEQRSRASQLASLASKQSQRLPDRAVYEAEVARWECELDGQEVPRPPHWHGYRIIPQRIEFWIGRDARMHDRTVYELVDGDWQRFLLYP